MKNSFTFALAILFALSCSTPETTYTVETINGVRNVHNYAPSMGDEPDAALEFVQKIGGIDVVDENYILYRIRDITRDSKDNIYILDGGNIRVQKYDSKGIYLSTIGREGQGPGEFSFPIFIDIDQNGYLYIWDSRLRKIYMFSGEGQYERSIAITYLPMVRDFHVMLSGEFLLNAWVLDTNTNISGAPLSIIGKGTPMLKIIDMTGQKTNEFLDQMDYGSPLPNLNVNSVRSTVDKTGNIYVSHFMLNRIEKFSQIGEQIFVADRQLNYEIYPTAAENNERGNPTIITDTGTFVTESIGIDRKGRIWVSTYLSQTEKSKSFGEYRDKLNEIPGNLVFQVFDSDGIWLYNVEIPFRFSKVRFFDDRVYFIDMDMIAVHEYKIVERN